MRLVFVWSLFAIFLSMAKTVLATDDWPQFRGPTGQGLTETRGLPLEWSESRNIVWKTATPGVGWSSPVIADGKIWMTTAAADGTWLGVVRVDRDSGVIERDEVLFRAEAPLPKNAKNSFASPTPILEDGRLYAHYGALGTACLDTVSGSVLWSDQSLRVDHKEGPGSSPVLWGELLILTLDGTDSQFLAALDKRTGALVWRVDRSGKLNDNADHRKAYSTPLVVNVDGRPELVSTTADRAIAYDPATGNEWWRVEYSGFSNVPRPAFAHGLIHLTTGYPRPRLLAVRGGGSGDVTTSRVAWHFDTNVPANPSPIVVGNEIFFVNDKGIATCLDALSGEKLWTERLGGNFSASPISDGRSVHFMNEDGVATVIAASREYEVLAENKLDGRLMASPAVSQSAMYVRTDTHLYRIEDRAAVALSAAGAP